MRGIPSGQIMQANHAFFEDQYWTFLKTFEGRYDLWLKHHEDWDNETLITIRWFHRGEPEIAQWFIHQDIPSYTSEPLKRVYREALRRAQVHIYGDPSVSPSARKKGTS